MTTIFAHMLVPLTTGLGLGKQHISRRLLVAGMLASVLPDFDVIGFQLGVAYASPFGHRGFSHSLFMAVLIGVLALCLHRQLHTSRLKALVFVSLSMFSHGVLDMLTSGGLGVAALWPLNDTRYFWDYRPIRVSPIGAGFFSARGAQTLVSELAWVLAPSLVWFALLKCGSIGFAKHTQSKPR